MEGGRQFERKMVYTLGEKNSFSTHCLLKVRQLISKRGQKRSFSNMPVSCSVLSRAYFHLGGDSLLSGIRHDSAAIIYQWLRKIIGIGPSDRSSSSSMI